MKACDDVNKFRITKSRLNGSIMEKHLKEVHEILRNKLKHYKWNTAN